jgi:hypothetical protein
MTTKTCKNCNQNLRGKFCYQCGEKIVEPNDFSLKTMLEQFVDGVFSVDSKVFKTFSYLLFKPGVLTQKYIDGIRKPYMKPIQVFLITNILFFLLLTQSDILRVPAKYYFTSDKETQLERELIDSKYSKIEFKQAYDIKSSNLSKALVILIVPFLALILWILNYKSKALYGMHLIFSIHYLSFFFLCCLSAFSVSMFGNRAIQFFIVSLNLLYLIIAIKKVYKNSLILSLSKSLFLIIAFVFLTSGYRTLISYLSFKML